MGRQINFYMAEADEQQFLTFLRSDPAVRILMDCTPTPEPGVLQQLPTRDVPGWFLVSLWKRDISPAPQTDYVPQRREYSLNRYASEVVEFHRSCLDDEGRLARGRLWAEFIRWDPGNPRAVIEKSVAFKRWFHRLVAWIRRRATRAPTGWWMMPAAAAFAKQGGRLLS